MEVPRGPAGRAGSRCHPRPFRGQNYRSLLRSCLRAGVPFQDQVFPASPAALGDVAPQVAHWRRPYQIQQNPCFFVERASRFDVCQGNLGDCWFLSALTSLTMQPDLFAHVVPQGQDFQRDYCGIFHFRFWYFGDWVDVVIDDYLPTNQWNQLIFVRSRDKNEFWCALLEKAYAKLYGSYGDLHMGRIAEAMVDFSGGIKMEMPLWTTPADLWTTLRKALDLGSFVGCSTSIVSDGELRTATGLVMTHAYTITGAEQVSYQNHLEELVRVRNPWGNEVEWNRAWSDRSSLWNRIDTMTRERLLLNQEDGEFWMAVQDFTKHFAQLVICSQMPEFLKGPSSLEWTMSQHHGSWLPGYSAGGALHSDLYCSNPQYCVTLMEGDVYGERGRGRGTTSLTMCLLQKPRSLHRKALPPLAIACHLFKVSPTVQVQNQKLPQTFFNMHPPLMPGLNYMEIREVSNTYQLGAGTYIMVPSTKYPNEPGDFLLRVYYQRAKHQRSSPEPSQHDYSVWEQIFDQHAQGAELDVTGLQQVLNNIFLCGERVSENFSLHQCRAMVLLLTFDSPGNLDGSGRLNKLCFRNFWKKLESLKDLFHQTDVDGLGLLDLTDLYRCLHSMDYPVNKQEQKLLALRFGDSSGRVSLESFIHCVLRLEFTTKMFVQVSRGRPRLSLNEEEVRKTSINPSPPSPGGILH
ncbi:calpain-8-like [Narcine bancroftii]|uniref:calpain-8-like n=1 Tax=Narcine bancroftii TaxID=1343680 RepID=UPI0038311436